MSSGHSTPCRQPTGVIDCHVRRKASRESIFVSTSSRGVIDARDGFTMDEKQIQWLQRRDSKPPRTNPRTRAGPLPVEQYELLLDGQRLLIIMEIILLNKVCSNIIYHRIAN